MAKEYIQKFIKVGNIHTISYCEYGNPLGVPVLMLHGGPGGNINRRIIELIDLTFFRLFTIDQRGCGESTPKGELRENSTFLLVDDIEKIRQHENLGKCIIFGRSWGTTLGLLYALKYPESCLFLVLRGIFLGRDEDEEWTFRGAGKNYPNEWRLFSSGLDVQRPLNVQFFDKIFNGDEKTAVSMSSRMTNYFNLLATNVTGLPERLDTEDDLIANKIFLHYSVNHYFFEDDYWERHLKELDEHGLEGVILHGGKDNDCRVEQACFLHDRWKRSQLIIEPYASHCDNQPEIRKQIYNIFMMLKKRFS